MARTVYSRFAVVLPGRRMTILDDQLRPDLFVITVQLGGLAFPLGATGHHGCSRSHSTGRTSRTRFFDPDRLGDLPLVLVFFLTTDFERFAPRSIPPTRSVSLPRPLPVPLTGPTVTPVPVPLFPPPSPPSLFFLAIFALTGRRGRRHASTARTTGRLVLGRRRLFVPFAAMLGGR